MRKLNCYFTLCLTAIIVFANNSFAQSAPESLIRVHYKFTHVTDTNLPNKPLVRDMLLDVKPAYSSFYLDNRAPKPATPKAEGGGAPVARKRVVGMPVVMIKSDPMANELLYQSVVDKQLVQLASPGVGQYQIVSALPEIKWKLYKEQKTIGDYLCQKATGNFGGRNYTVWFAPSLPYAFGPWKLNGLPGLILEANDDRGQVQFTFKEITEGTELFTLDDVKKSAVVLTNQEYEKAKQRFLNDPVGTAQSSLPPGVAAEVAIMFEDETGNTLSGQEALEAIQAWGKKKVNNPLDLNKVSAPKK